ncbi:restriction endonuclease subunit S [Mammaliicoccus sciuri]|uniref:restriction endonuclease subunit S n=1 Tax=Mammaliicoccus sciuri TaxID=1296 RepID=UPI000D1F6CC8|nr:restriction endonuclease subunit S [Mammaliicoccus sciuri]PTK28520.1 restriction endonuclease subunit S [Mammaliicoccus sciuri]
MEYNTVFFGDVAKIKNGYAFKSKEFKEEGIPVIKIKNISSPIVDIKDTQKVSIKTYEETKNFLLKKDDILISLTGSGVNQMSSAVGKVGKIEFDYTALQNQRVGKFELKYTNSADLDFLFYYFLQPKITNYLVRNSTGSANQANISSKLIESVKIPNFSLKKQKSISKFLNQITRKIEINKKIIANLEELSQTLFKRWFVDFEFPDENGNPYKSSGGEMIDSELGEIPLNWKCSKIKDINVIISDHVANGSFKSLKENVQFTEDLNDKYAVFARNVDLKKGDNRFEKYVTKSSYEFLRKSHLHGHEVIISNVGDVGSVYLSPILNRPMVLGNNQIFINSDEKSLNYYFYLFFKSSIGKNLIDSITSGSVQMKFNKTDLRNSLIVFPCKNDMNNLITVIKKYIYSIENKKSENMQLIQLRDTLLPKLMSGEIEIPDDIEVNEDELSI